MTAPSAQTGFQHQGRVSRRYASHVLTFSVFGHQTSELEKLNFYSLMRRVNQSERAVSDAEETRVSSEHGGMCACCVRPSGCSWCPQRSPAMTYLPHEAVPLSAAAPCVNKPKENPERRVDAENPARDVSATQPPASGLERVQYETFTTNEKYISSFLIVLF